MAYDVIHAALALLVAIEAVLLREVLSRVVWLGQLQRDLIEGMVFPGQMRRTLLPPGTSIPSFRAPVLGRRESLTPAQLQGHNSILMFVGPDTPVSANNIAMSMHALWHKSDGNLYVVCRGTDIACQRLLPAITCDKVKGTIPATVLVLLCYKNCVRQKGQQESCCSKACASPIRKVAIESGL
jgi:hypothetical protein